MTVFGFPPRSGAGLLGRPAAVHVPGDTAHIVGGGRAEEHRQLAQFFRGGELQRRLFLPQQLPGGLFVGDALGGRLGVHLFLHQRGQHPAGADGIAGHAAGGVLQGRDLGEADDAVLGRHIGRLLGRAHQAVHRGHIDDAAPVGLLHGRQRQARGVKGAGQVDGDDGVPFVHRKVLHRRHMLDAGVVDQDVHPAELAGGVLHHVFDVGHAAHVGTVVGHLGAGCLAGGQHFGAGGVHITETVQDDIGALAGEGFCNTEADAAGGASDEGRFAFEHVSHSE